MALGLVGLIENLIFFKKIFDWHSINRQCKDIYLGLLLAICMLCKILHLSDSSSSSCECKLWLI